jgi:SynChlorMet cassette radical SAM/SPASM protein ScmE
MKKQVSTATHQSPPKVMYSPRSVDVEITSRCNLRCRYCYFFDNPAVDYQDLPTEEWLAFFDELGQDAVMYVTLQGGEPFIRKDFPALIEGIVRNRMRFSILSNGTLIDNDIAAFIAGTGRCDTVQVSIDGSGPEPHDACRGKGSFKAAMKGIHALQRQGVDVSVRVTLHRFNIHDLKNIARLLLEELDLGEFTTNSAAYLGSCRLNGDEVMLRTEDRGLAMEKLVCLANTYDGRITATAGPLAEARLWSAMENARTNEAEPFSFGGRLTGCGCTDNNIAVRADGMIIPCCMLANMEVGRINQDSLAEVWQHSPVLNRLRGRHTISLTEFEFCSGCPYIPYCTGNCPGTAHSLTGHTNHPSPDACFKRFLEAGGRLPNEKLYIKDLETEKIPPTPLEKGEYMEVPLF